MNKVGSFFRELLSWFLYLAVWLIVVFAVYRWIAQPFSVDGASMEHTLEDGQRLWMVKFADIEQFDVVIFPQPDARPGEEEKLYVKRIIGVPGDTVAYEDDQLILNGSVMTEPYLEEKASEFKSFTGGDFTADFSLEAITGEMTVPEGKFFVLGDNRRNSVDGRHFGFIEADSVLGEADFIYWPLQDFGLLNKYDLNESETAIVEQ